MFCIDKAISFITDSEHLKLAAQWIHGGTIAIDGEELQCELTNDHKYAILKRYYSSIEFTLDEKHALKEATFKSDDSDAGKKVQKVCDYSLPDEKLKEKLWEEILDANTKDSLMDSRLKIQGFW